MEVRQKPIFNKIKYWVDTYGSTGAEDRRAVQDFYDCEATEAVNSLKYELAALAQGEFDENILNQLVGNGRKEKHGSYSAWAKLMLLWFASAR